MAVQLQCADYVPATHLISRGEFADLAAPVGSEATVRSLQKFIEVALGWEDKQLHKFFIRVQFYDKPRPDCLGLHTSLDAILQIDSAEDRVASKQFVKKQQVAWTMSDADQALQICKAVGVATSVKDYPQGRSFGCRLSPRSECCLTHAK